MSKDEECSKTFAKKRKFLRYFCRESADPQVGERRYCLKIFLEKSSNFILGFILGPDMAVGETTGAGGIVNLEKTLDLNWTLKSLWIRARP